VVIVKHGGSTPTGVNGNHRSSSLKYVTQQLNASGQEGMCVMTISSVTFRLDPHSILHTGRIMCSKIQLMRRGEQNVSSATSVVMAGLQRHGERGVRYVAKQTRLLPFSLNWRLFTWGDIHKHRTAVAPQHPARCAQRLTEKRFAW
jgi:hypothetical protein